VIQLCTCTHRAATNETGKPCQ